MLEQMNGEMANKPRRFTTELPAIQYLQLEMVALQRGMKGYNLAGRVLSAWLNGEFVLRDNANEGAAVAPPLSPSPSVAARE